MISAEKEKELRRLAMQLAVMAPAEREEAIAALEGVEAILEALDGIPQGAVAKQMASITPDNPLEARLVLDLAREFLDYSDQRTQVRLHSLRRAAGAFTNEVIEFKRR